MLVCIAAAVGQAKDFGPPSLFQRHRLHRQPGGWLALPPTASHPSKRDAARAPRSLPGAVPAVLALCPAGDQARLENIAGQRHVWTGKHGDIGCWLSIN